MATAYERLDQIVRVLHDPVADLPDNEALKLVYHYAMYELFTFRINRLIKKRLDHGDFISNTLVAANFKHELKRL